MEADVNTAWYRPTALFDVTEGGELGWRTGWAKWPEHYFDRLPNLLETGRGSPDRSGLLRTLHVPGALSQLVVPGRLVRGTHS